MPALFLLTMLVVIGLGYRASVLHRGPRRSLETLLTGTAGLVYAMLAFLVIAGSRASSESFHDGLQHLMLSSGCLLMLCLDVAIGLSLVTDAIARPENEQ